MDGEGYQSRNQCDQHLPPTAAETRSSSTTTTTAAAAAAAAENGDINKDNN
jgi:hypothetical protein